MSVNFHHSEELVISSGIDQCCSIKLFGVYSSVLIVIIDLGGQFKIIVGNYIRFILGVCRSHGYSRDDLHVLFIYLNILISLLMCGNVGVEILAIMRTPIEGFTICRYVNYFISVLYLLVV